MDYTTHKDCRLLSHIPGNYGVLPYVGNTLALWNDLYGFIDNNYKQFGELSRVKVLGQPSVLVLGADNLQDIYLDRNNNFSSKMGYDNTLGYFFKNALLLSDFDEHRIQRRMFQNAFKSNQMQGYVKIMNPIIQSHMSSWQNEKTFIASPAIKKTLLDIGSTVFIGTQPHGTEIENLNQAFLNITEKGLMSLFRINLPGFKFHKGLQGKRYLEKYFSDIIPVRRSGLGNDMMSIITKEKLENGQFYDDKDIISQMSFLLFAAHDTTTSLLTLIIYHLANNIEWQEILRQEAKDLSKTLLSFEDLNNLPMMELVFKEALRMHPSASLMLRRTLKETKMGQYRIPANTVLTIPPVYNHFMETFWSNPQNFDPMRFSEGREEHKKHSFCYIPFGGGAHKCIGMHFANMIVKCVLFPFLLNYQWRLESDYRPELTAFPLPTITDGLRLQLQRIT